MTALLSVRNLETWYGPVRALHGVSLEVHAAQIVTVLGANGAGKTTLLNTIAGVLAPSNGTVEFEGRPVGGKDADEVARGGVVLVPEGRQIFPFLTIAENLRMGAFARRDAEIARDMEQMYDWFPRLRERQRQQAGLLSGGEQQMLAISRALMGRPRLLLLDEPSLGLSPLFTKDIFAIIKRIREQTRTAVLVVEQNAAIALATADHGYVIELGRVAAAGSCEALSQREDIKEFYLGGASHHLPQGVAGGIRPARRRPSWN
ncbi:ABC transporter ATP-binding protein [Variovorax fucosicus]|uniref:ABC transporter ATP-binding protein n=1 Tax=Variovorax fucosicus TaxID=3053517 RepID=UPI002577F716|nr:ABC transporter ATP-binding protein [Variovorax sp. J22G47]MDM0057643.1 ABC transporter ATP-binding protein [Variovorax sp. J22G47]